MSSESFDTSTTDSEAAGDDHGRTARPLAGLAFWSAVVLPFVQVGLLLNGVRTRQATTVLAALFVVNVFALVVGHRYGLE